MLWVVLLTCYLTLHIIFLYFSKVSWTPLFPLSPSVANSMSVILNYASLVSSLICYLSKYPLQSCANVELSEQQEWLPPFWQTDSSCCTDIQNRHSQSFSGDSCFRELTSDSLFSTFPLKTNNWGCSKEEHYVISKGQYRCVPSFYLPCTLTFFTQVLGATWANNTFTSSGFTYKATPVSHPVSPVLLIQTQTGLDLFHTWSKNAYYGSATGITNPDWGDLCVLKKFTTRIAWKLRWGTCTTRQISQWLKHYSHLLSKNKLSVSWTFSLKVFSIC